MCKVIIFINNFDFLILNLYNLKPSNYQNCFLVNFIYWKKDSPHLQCMMYYLLLNFLSKWNIYLTLKSLNIVIKLLFSSYFSHQLQEVPSSKSKLRVLLSFWMILSILTRRYLKNTGVILRNLKMINLLNEVF